MNERKKSVLCKKNDLKTAWVKARNRQRKYKYLTDEELTRDFLKDEWERLKRKEDSDPIVKNLLKEARKQGMDVPEKLSRSSLENPVEYACPRKYHGRLDLYTGCKRSDIEEASNLFEITNMHKEEWYEYLHPKEIKEFGESMFGSNPEKDKANKIIEDNLFRHRESDVKLLDGALEILRSACPRYTLP